MLIKLIAWAFHAGYIRSDTIDVITMFRDVPPVDAPGEIPSLMRFSSTVTAQTPTSGKGSPINLDSMTCYTASYDL